MTAEPGSIQYRLSEPRDSADLADLRWPLTVGDSKAGDPVERARFTEAYVGFIEAGTSDHSLFNWVAEAGDRIVAMMSVRKVAACPSPERLEDHWGYLTNAYTLPQYRSKNVGSELLNHVKRWAAEQGLELLVVWPSERAYAFYERAGFRRYDDPLVFKIDERE